MNVSPPPHSPPQPAWNPQPNLFLFYNIHVVQYGEMHSESLKSDLLLPDSQKEHLSALLVYWRGVIRRDEEIEKAAVKGKKKSTIVMWTANEKQDAQ